MKAEEKLKRFDDIYKLSLTLVAITLAFGSTFLEELGTDFFASVLLNYFIFMVSWSIGHLSNNIQDQTSLKLAGWWGFTTFLPFVILNYLMPREHEIRFEEPYPPFLSISVLAGGFLLYLSTYVYLKRCFSAPTRARALFLIPFTQTVVLAIAGFVKWGLYA